MSSWEWETRGLHFCIPQHLAPGSELSPTRPHGSVSVDQLTESRTPIRRAKNGAEMLGWAEEQKPGPGEAGKQLGLQEGWGGLRGAEERGCISRDSWGGARVAEGPRKHLWENPRDCQTPSGVQQGVGSMGAGPRGGSRCGEGDSGGGALGGAQRQPSKL